MANEDGIRVDENVANHEPEDLLAFAGRRMGGRVAEATEEVLKVVGQLQLGAFTGQLLVEGFHLATQAPFPAAELGHASTEAVQLAQLFLVHHEKTLGRCLGSAKLPLEVSSLGRGRQGSAVILETAGDLTTDERRLRREAHDVFPNEIVKQEDSMGSVAEQCACAVLAVGQPRCP